MRNKLQLFIGALVVSLSACMEQPATNVRAAPPTMAERCEARFGAEVVSVPVVRWLDRAVASGVPLAGERFESRHEYIVRTNEALGALTEQQVFRFGEFRDAWYDVPSSRIMVPTAALAGEHQIFLRPSLSSSFLGVRSSVQREDIPYNSVDHEVVTSRQMYPVGDDFFLARDDSIFGYVGETLAADGQIARYSAIRREAAGYDTPWVFVVDITRAELTDIADEIAFAFIGRPVFPYIVEMEGPSERQRAAVVNVSCIALVAGDRVLATAPAN